MSLHIMQLYRTFKDNASKTTQLHSKDDSNPYKPSWWINVFLSEMIGMCKKNTNTNTINFKQVFSHLSSDSNKSYIILKVL